MTVICTVDAPWDADVEIEHDGSLIAQSCDVIRPPFQWEACDVANGTIAISIAATDEWPGPWLCIVETLSEINESSSKMFEILRKY